MIDTGFKLKDEFEIPNDLKKINIEYATPRGNIHCIVRKDKNIYRKAFSETQLLDVLGFNFQDGESYHCITAGDVDSLSYLKCVLRQQNLEYCLLSTWCMAEDDAMQLEEWISQGKIKKLDCYLGEIFPSSYANIYLRIKNMYSKHRCGRIAIFRNHAKIYAGYGDKFYFGIETSANINTNPRAENGCVTIGKEIYEFYKDYFDKIISIV